MPFGRKQNYKPIIRKQAFRGVIDILICTLARGKQVRGEETPFMEIVLQMP